MSGICKDEKHNIEKQMRDVAINIKELNSYFTIDKDFEKVILINKIKNELDSIFLKFEKIFNI